MGSELLGGDTGPKMNKFKKYIFYPFFGTKLVNMSLIMVYLAMFITLIDKILCFLVLIR